MKSSKNKICIITKKVLKIIEMLMLLSMILYFNKSIIEIIVNNIAVILNANKGMPGKKRWKCLTLSACESCILNTYIQLPK